MSTDITTPSGGTLAVRPDQTKFSPEQAAVLQQSGIDNDVTNAELAGFLHLTQRTGLDPFSRQIYLIGRYDSRQGRKVFTPQTSIDGYRVIAHRVVAAAGQSFGYEDTLWCDSSGRWYDVWLAEEPPAAAKVVVVRNGQRFPAVAKYAEYVQRGKGDKVIGLWNKMPATMTAKCAEALALRMAFPHDLAGVYTAEEMAQADGPAEEERHLKAVRADEPDPWATPASTERNYVAEAHAATSAEDVRRIYREAAADGYGPGTETLTEIAEVGKRKAAGESTATVAESAIVDAEIVPDADPVEQAERQLRAVAARVGLDTLDADFQQSYGIPIAEAGVQQLAEMTQILGGAA